MRTREGLRCSPFRNSAVSGIFLRHLLSRFPLTHGSMADQTPIDPTQPFAPESLSRNDLLARIAALEAQRDGLKAERDQLREQLREAFGPSEEGHRDRFRSAEAQVRRPEAAVAALQESEGRLRLALALAELGTWTWDLDTGAGTLDTRAAEIVGLPAGTLPNVAEAQQASIHPDDLARVGAEVEAGLHSGSTFSLAYRTLHPDGSVHYVASRASVVADATGRPIRLVGTNRDVTAEREAEAALRKSEVRYRTLFESIDEGFCIIEMIFDGEGRAADYRFLEINPAFEEHTGLHDALGRTIRKLAPAHEEHWFDAYGRVAQTGEPIRFTNRADALGRWYDVFAFRVDEPEKRKVALLFTDVSERRRADEERERLLHDAEVARAEAEAANRTKSEFLAVMSHELRTPLNAIGGYAELIEMGVRGPVTEAQLSDLRRIQASQRHLLGLINEVLNYARLETGSVHYDITEVPVEPALRAAEALVDPQAHAKGLEIEVSDCPADLAVRADAEKLRQILVNLLSNAVKFTDHGTIELACGVDGGQVVVRVRDTGIGIPPEKLDEVFEPFVQVRSDLTRTAEGTGLGLAISRDRARAMRGDLTVESTPGVGSTLTLTLPRNTAEKVDVLGLNLALTRAELQACWSLEPGRR